MLILDLKQGEAFIVDGPARVTVRSVDRRRGLARLAIEAEESVEIRPELTKAAEKPYDTASHR